MQKGFTLIELMIVVAIIGILASIALPSYQTYTTRAQLVESLVIVDELKSSVKEYYKIRGEFPVDNTHAGIPESQYLLGNYVAGIELENGAFHITLGNKINTNLAGKVLSIRPLSVTESPQSPISWLCGNGSIPQGMSASGENKTNIESAFLPGACRI